MSVSGRNLEGGYHEVALLDLLPAGFEIESVLNEETAKSFPFLSKLTVPRIAEGRDDRFFASFNLGDRLYRTWWDSEEPLRQLLSRRLHRPRRHPGHLRAAGDERLRHVRPARLCPQRHGQLSRSATTLMAA